MSIGAPHAQPFPPKISSGLGGGSWSGPLLDQGVERSAPQGHHEGIVRVIGPRCRGDPADVRLTAKDSLSRARRVVELVVVRGPHDESVIICLLLAPPFYQAISDLVRGSASGREPSVAWGCEYSFALTARNFVTYRHAERRWSEQWLIIVGLARWLSARTPRPDSVRASGDVRRIHDNHRNPGPPGAGNPAFGPPALLLSQEEAARGSSLSGTPLSSFQALRPGPGRAFPVRLQIVSRSPPVKPRCTDPGP
jgi:hypothetical protein